MEDRPRSKSTCEPSERQTGRSTERYRDLQALADLYESGRISDREFRRRKRRLLLGPTPDSDHLEMIVATYSNEDEANAALTRLRRLQRDRVILIIDGTAVARNPSGRIRASEHDMNAIGDESVIDRLAEIVRAPVFKVLRSDSEALDEALREWTDYGFSANDLASIGRQLKPGQSAVFAVVFNLKPDRIAEELEGFAAYSRHTLGPSIIRLPSEDEDRSPDDG